MFKVEKKEIFDGYDCWGVAEYAYVYVVLDKNGNEIYQSKDDPTELINVLINNK